MDLGYYVFAFFIFLLICAVIWFFSKTVRTSKKDEKSDFGKEQQLFKLYQNVEDMMTSFEEYIEEAKTELNQKISEITSMLDKLNSTANDIELNKNEDLGTSTNTAQRKKTPVDGAVLKAKPEEMITSLINDGMTMGEIAKELGMSSREVSLIMEIKKIKESEKNL